MDDTVSLWLPGGLRSPFNEGCAAALEAALDEASDADAAIASDDDVELVSSWKTCFEFPDEGAYDLMVQDEQRAMLYERAIRDRMHGHNGDLIIVDVGTGPYALLAILSARMGAKRVYAIEANPKAAKSARRCIELASDIPAGTIIVLEGFSTALNLPEKADLLVAEIVGSVASEEGLIATMRDAQNRLLKHPFDTSSYIPTSVSTLIAPAAHALHHVLRPPEFDWVAGLRGHPLRCGTGESALQLLAAPQVVEHICFHLPLPEPGRWDTSASDKPVCFQLCEECIARSEASFAAVLSRERVVVARAAPLAQAMARSLSGFAFWPRLDLDASGELVIDARSMKNSHWQTVLPLLRPRPIKVSPSNKLVNVSLAVELPAGVDEPSCYTLRCVLRRAMVLPRQWSEDEQRNHAIGVPHCAGSDSFRGSNGSCDVSEREEQFDDNEPGDDEGVVYSAVYTPSPTGRRLRPVVVPR